MLWFGDNGIISNAQNANIKTGMAVLEEFLQEKYVENYDRFSNNESKVVQLQKIYQEYFYIPSNEGIGSLRYIVDSNGHALYLIKKSGLPKEIRDGLAGGNAGEGKYSDYATLNDVYGVTSDLKVYYSAGNGEKLVGITSNELDKDNPFREVFQINNTGLPSLLISYDQDENGILTAEEVKSVKSLNIDKNSCITSFSEFYKLTSLRELTVNGLTLDNLDGIQNCSQLNYVYFKSSTFADYSALTGVNKLKYLYLYNIDDSELLRLCFGIKSANFLNLQYLAIVGNESNISSVQLKEYRSNKSSKTITSITPLATLSPTTKNSVKYLSLQNNNIESDLSALDGFNNVILLRFEFNNITSLNGLENMSNITYLSGRNNKIGSLLSGTKEIGEDNATGIAIKSLANKNHLNIVYLNDNPNLSNVIYFANDTNITCLHLAGCSPAMNVNVIKDRILDCGSNYSLPVKFLTGSVYDVSMYYNPGEAIYNELYSDLYENTYITHLNLEGCTKLTNIQLNTILGSMTNLQYVTLKDNTTLTTIDFVGEGKVTSLIELDIKNTGVTNLSNLNLYAQNLRTLRVTDEVDVSSFVQTINRLNSDGTAYWNNDQGNTGFIMTTLNGYKKLEGLTDLTRLDASYNNLARTYSKNDLFIDLSGTSLTYLSFYGCKGTIKVPTTITSCTMGNGGIVQLSGESPNITAIYCSNMCFKSDYFNQCTTSYKYATKLKNITITFCGDFGVNKISDIIDYDMPNIMGINFSFWNPDGTNWLKSLDGVEHFTNLQTLNINNQMGISDFSALREVKYLNNLYASNCKISGLDFLSSLTNLIYLDLSTNNINSLRSIADLTKLNYLNLTNNLISDRSSYIDSEGRTITYNNIEILANLNSNKNGALKKLYLSENSDIIDFSQIAKLTWDDKSGF